jgi:hypothetical protein
MKSIINKYPFVIIFNLYCLANNENIYFILCSSIYNCIEYITYVYEKIFYIDLDIYNQNKILNELVNLNYHYNLKIYNLVKNFNLYNSKLRFGIGCTINNLKYLDYTPKYECLYNIPISNLYNNQYKFSIYTYVFEKSINHNIIKNYVNNYSTNNNIYELIFNIIYYVLNIELKTKSIKQISKNCDLLETNNYLKLLKSYDSNNGFKIDIYDFKKKTFSKYVNLNIYILNNNNKFSEHNVKYNIINDIKQNKLMINKFNVIKKYIKLPNELINIIKQFIIY